MTFTVNEIIFESNVFVAYKDVKRNIKAMRINLFHFLEFSLVI